MNVLNCWEPLPEETVIKDDLTHHRSVDVGGAGGDIDGVLWETQAAAEVTTNASLVSKPDLALSPATSPEHAAMILNARYRSLGMKLSMPVASSSYDVYVTVFEDNNPIVYDLALEGVTVISGGNSGPGGTWQRLGPFRTTIPTASSTSRPPEPASTSPASSSSRFSRSRGAWLRVARAHLVHHPEENDEAGPAEACFCG